MQPDSTLAGIIFRLIDIIHELKDHSLHYSLFLSLSLSISGQNVFTAKLISVIPHYREAVRREMDLQSTI